MIKEMEKLKETEATRETKEATRETKEATREATRETKEATREATRETEEATREATRETEEATREATRETEEQLNLDSTSSNQEREDCLNLDFTSPNPLEIEFLHLNLITDSQYNFIKQFQRAYNKQREQPSIISYELKPPGRRAKINKIKSSLEDIADDCKDYHAYLFKYGERNIKIIEEYFCNNLTMQKLKERYTIRKITRETIEKKKKRGNKNKNENENNENNENKNKEKENIKAKEVEKIKEYFEETKLIDDLWMLLKMLDRIEWNMMNKEERTTKKWNMMDDEERIIKKLIGIVERMGKREVMKKLNLKNNLKLLDKILNGYDDYSLNIFKRIKSFVVKHEGIND